MQQNLRTAGWAYFLALLGTAGAALIRQELEPILTGAIPVVIFTVPVVICAFYGGLRPGLFCTVISALVSDFLFIKPYYSLAVDAQGAVILLTFCAVGITISLFGQRMKALQARLEEQTKQLVHANAALQREGARKDEFLAMLAHELRNPLAGISTASELLRMIPAEDARIRRAGDAIFRQARHMTKLVDDLMDVSRVTRGLVEIEKLPVDLQEVLQNAIQQVQSAIDAKSQQLTLDIREQDIWVIGDRTRLTQVISNLLANANRYSHPGGKIKIAVSCSKDAISIQVSDNGVGIDATLLPRIFDLFVQADRSSDRSAGGLGIGLALVRKITELHGGSVSAYSRGLGQGSSFTVHMARGDKPHLLPVEARGRVREHGDGKNGYVLIVDDNQDAADSTAALLVSYGYRVAVEYDAEGALACAGATAFSGIILDIGMPDLDGRALCRRMKNFPHLVDTRFVALSGYGQPADLLLSKTAGFDIHLTKPVLIENLLSALGAGDIDRTDATELATA